MIHKVSSKKNWRLKATKLKGIFIVAAYNSNDRYRANDLLQTLNSFREKSFSKFAYLTGGA